MRIGFDGKRAMANKTGLGNYSRFTISALVKFCPSYSIDIYAPNCEKVKEYNNLILDYPEIKEHIPKRRITKIFSTITRLFSLSKYIAKDCIETFHGLSNELPFNLKKMGIKSVVTIHDLIFLKRPKDYSFFDRKIYNFKFRYACENADKIVAISECTKRDIIELYGISSGKISVVYQGCGEQFSQRHSEETIQKIRAKYNLPKRFFLTVGTLEERKNLQLCVEALRHLPADIGLVAVGRATKYSDRVIHLASQMGVENRITFIHNCDYIDLPLLYQCADVFCYPSRYEGFGIPIIEAISSGIPVVAKTGSCLEEAGGDGAIYVDPDDSKALAGAIAELISNPTLRASKIAAGAKHIEQFRAEKIADKLDAIYSSLLNNSCQ